MTRECRTCGGAIPEGKRRHAVYCSDNCRKRRWELEDEVRLTCARCGAQGGSARRHKTDLCAACYHDDQRAQGDVTFRKLEALWRAGKTYPEIEREMGWAKGTVSGMLARGREYGYDLPHRYDAERRANQYAKRWGAAA